MWQDIKNVYHFFIAVLVNIWYGFPSRGLVVIGVTGTDGKTTTTSIIYHILKNSGYNASMISSVGAKINGKDFDIGFHVTTASPFKLQRFIKKAKEGIGNNGKNFLVLETTSHALDQYRVLGIDFEVSVLTNITDEHLDYHKTYQNYVKTKAKLFKKTKFSILNKDDKSYKIITNLINTKNKKTKKITYAIEEDADYTLKKFPVETKLETTFNKYNILAAISACKALGIDDEKIRNGIKTFTLPIGRVEEVYKKEFTVIVDFAHTPNSIENVLSALNKKAKKRLIHVFGSAGERDNLKRPKMGEASSKYSDIIILTAEDPRSESVDKINEQIEGGISSKFKFLNYSDYKDKTKNKKIYFKINDRQEAISFAISIAKRGDLIILTGKSHEKSMNLGKGEEPWSEYEAVKKGLEKRF